MSGFLAPFLVFILVFVGIVYFLSRTTGEANVKERLGRLSNDSLRTSRYAADAAGNPETNFLETRTEKSATAKIGEQLVGLMGKDLVSLEKEMRLQFVRAGIDSPNALGNHVLFRFVAVPVAVVVAYFLLNNGSGGMMHLLSVLSALSMVVIAWFGPHLYLTNTKQKRQKILQRSFPDTLDLILVCVESGLALDAALARVCRELGRAHPEITKEFNRTRMELTLLSDRSVALQNLGERTDLVAFRSLVAALLQTEKFGTSLTETLRVLSDDYRHTRLMLAENKAGKLPALMTVPMILLMMPAFFMIIMGPAMIQVAKLMK